MSTAPDRQAKIQAATGTKRSPLPWIAGALVLLLLAGGIIFALMQNSKKNDETKGALDNLTAPPNGNSAKSGIVAYKGKAGAPVVALYQDYQCPACQALEKEVGPTLEQMGKAGQITLEYHTMTFLDDKWNTKASHQAAEAAACADVVGAYPKYHDVVYANQVSEDREIKGDSYTADQLRVTFPKDAGITGANLTTFQQCYDKGLMKNWVIGTNDAATKEQISGTPRIHVNGKEFNLTGGFKNAEDFKAKLLAAGK